MAVRRIPVLPTNDVVDLLLRNVQYAHSGDLQNTAECHICNEPFLTGCDPERPVVLRCGHIMGEGCILKWMSPLSGSGSQNSCPLCRKPLLYATPPPTRQLTQAGDSERSRSWCEFWDELGDRLRIERNQAWDELCELWHQTWTDLRSFWHQVWHQFCSGLQMVSDVVSNIGLLYAAVLLLLFCMDFKPLPTPSFMLDWLRKHPTGQIGFQPTPTYP